MDTDLQIPNRKFTYAMYLIMAVALYFVFFQRLNGFHIRLWDESTFAVSAYEMLQAGDYLTPYSHGFKDNVWNLKPPLLLWVQMVFIKLLGFNELAVRLPSAIAGSLIAILLFIFTKRRSGLLFAYTVFFVYVSSAAVSSFHTGRTADPDAIYSLFILLSLYAFYEWIKSEQSRCVFMSFFWLTLAYFTQGIFALFYLPVLLGAAFYFKKAKQLFTSRAFLEGMALLIVTAAVYIILRNHEGPYLMAWTNDVLKTLAITEQTEELDFYVNRLFFGKFLWSILVIPGCFLMFKQASEKQFFIYLLFCFLLHILILSIVPVKHLWYAMPDLIILILFSSAAVYTLVQTIKREDTLRAGVLMLMLVVSIPYYFSARQSYKNEIPEDQKNEEAMAIYAFKQKKSGTLNGTVFLTTEFDLPLLFYKYYAKERGERMEIHKEVGKYPALKVILVRDGELLKQLQAKYNIELLEEFGPVKRVRVVSLR